MPDLNAQQAMEQAVHHARGQLSNGALVQGTLEHLWRLAYAAGVRMGQAAAPSSQRSQPWAEGVAARASGWTYGVVRLASGDRFIYGGVDREKPVCARQATVSGVYGSFRMTLDDTGERPRIPAMFWWKAVTEESGDAERV
jgi:hypothetical protein